MDAVEVQWRRGSSKDHETFTGRDGELTVDTTTWTVRVHDGITPGGHNAARVDLGNVNISDLRERVNAIGDGTQFIRLDSEGRLPAVDGSQLTNLPGSNYESLKAQIIQELIDQGLLGDNMPSIGSTKMGYTSPGDDYIVANGAMYNRANFPTLAASLGDKFNIESGTYTVQWPVIAYDLINQPISDGASNGSVVVTVGAGGGFWRSTDDGRSWNRGVAATANLNAIVYGKGMFVAVGANGTIVTSPSGATWNPASTGTTANFTTIAFVNNMFVAAGTLGAIAYSSNGTTWTVSTASSFTAQTVNAISFAMGVYIVAGTAGILVTSPDLTTWTLRTTGHTNSINAIAVNAAGTVAIAVGGASTTANIIGTTDGTTWTARTTTVAQARACLMWSNVFSAFICGGLLGTVVTSPDGSTWTTQAGANVSAGFGTTATVVNFLDRGTVVLGIGAGGVIVQMPALATYTMKVSGRGALVKLVPGATINSALAIGSSANSTPALSKTMDTGATWYFLASGLSTQGSRMPSHDGTLNICTASTQGGVYNCREIIGRQNLTLSGMSGANNTAYLNGKFWAVGALGGLSSSVDGQNWIANFSIPTSVSLTKIAYGNGVYVAVGTAGAAYSSTDGGETWTAILHTLGSLVFNALLFNNGAWVIANTTTANALVSTDGVTFAIKALPSNPIIGGFVVNGSFYLWTASVILSSVNAQVWASSGLGSTSVTDIAYGGGTFMAVGGISSTSFCATSTDGTTWTIRNMNYTGAIANVSYASGSFLASGSPAGVSCIHLQSSTNGLYWNQRTGTLGAMPSSMWTSIPNVGAFEYGVTNGGSAPNIIVAYPGPDQFRAPNVPPTSSYDGAYYIKAR